MHPRSAKENYAAGSIRSKKQQVTEYRSNRTTDATFWQYSQHKVSKGGGVSLFSAKGSGGVLNFYGKNGTFGAFLSDFFPAARY
jgi:hypothetical protein